jgi:8-oxo-dGTP diphosphatase
MDKSKERFKMIGSSYLILIRKNKILLSQRYNTGYEDGKYSLPAGHVEDGETLTECLIRETKEEIGINLETSYIKLIHVMHRRQTDIRVDYFFTCGNYKGELKNLEPDKCSDLAWFFVDKLPDITIPYIIHAIKSYQNNIWYSEFGW